MLIAAGVNIACPQCSTSYVISPELIPASGLPVRCTRCDSAFSAFADGRVEGAATVVAQGTSSTDAGPVLSDEALASALIPPRTLTPAAGAVATADPGQPKTSTQMMGQVSGTPAEFPAPKTSTQMMGQVGGTPAEFPTPKTSTQTMGQVGGTPAEFPAPKTSTQMMGQVSGTPAEFPTPKTSTQMMGQVSGGHAEAAAPPPSTRLMGQSEAAEGPSGTPLMGTPQLGRRSTLDFGLDAEPVQGDGRRSTLDFGLDAEPVQGDGRRSTLDFGLDTGPASGPRMTDEWGALHDPVMGSAESAPIRLPPEEGVPPALLSRPFREESGEAFAQTSGTSRGSGRWGWALLALVVIAAGVFGIQHVTAPRELPTEALTAHEEAHRLLLRDDAASLATAREQLGALVEQHPGFVAARADQALILALQIDDQRALADAHVAAQSRLRMQIEALERSQTPGDWRNRVNALRDGIGKHDQALATIGEEETRLRSALDASLARLPEAAPIDAPEVQRALARAQLFSLAITGSPEAMGMMERFRSAGGSEAWQILAETTYLLHAPGVQADDARRMRERLAGIKDQDASWLRVYLLDARLARTLGAGEDVRSNLEAVTVLNPAHGLARELRTLLQQR
ncbi:MAG TPA: zinc-ribbon domain-containing protein [Myxococcaceae bacterium]|nr:zinc-ribbon domain-containing protein [Myxococcaceae bacterium]